MTFNVSIDVVNRDKEKMEKILRALSIQLPARDLRHSDARVQLQAICAQWLPLPAAVLGQCIVLADRGNKLLYLYIFVIGFSLMYLSFKATATHAVMIIIVSLLHTIISI